MQKIGTIIFGIVFIGVAVFLYYKDIDLTKKCTEEVKATVIELEEEYDSDQEGATSYIYYPVVEYEVNGKVVKARMNKGSNPPEYNVNDKVTILYNPNKTDQFIVKGDNSNNLFMFIFGIAGLFITGYGIYLLIKKDNETVTVE